MKASLAVDGAVVEDAVERRQSIEHCFFGGGMPTRELMTPHFVWLLYELELMQERSPWRDIKTAPRDGTSVLVYVPSKPLPQNNAPSSRWKLFSPRMIEARWVVPPKDDAHVTISSYGRELESKFGGYWTADPRCIGPLRGMPTHWMSLPEPPQVSEANGSSK